MENHVHSALHWLIPLIIVVCILDCVWKPIALWKAARNSHTVWFICLFKINTIGILPIIYIILFKKKPAAQHDYVTKSSKFTIVSARLKKINKIVLSESRNAL